MSKLMSGRKKQVSIYYFFFIFSYNFSFEERIFITSSFTPIIFSKLSETTTCKVFLWIVALPKLYLKKNFTNKNFNVEYIPTLFSHHSFKRLNHEERDEDYKTFQIQQPSST